MISAVYKIQSIAYPNRIYIGSAGNILTRKNTHFFLLRNDKHHSKKLQRHYNKYGESDLIFSIITECSKDRLLIKEQCYINVFKPYFNCSMIAKSRRGVPWSKETRVKLTGIKKPCSEERKLKLIGNKNALGFKHTEETKNKHRFKRSDETRKRMSDSAKNRSENGKENILRGIKSRVGKPGCKHTEETKKYLSRIAIERHKKSRSYKVI